MKKNKTFKSKRTVALEQYYTADALARQCVDFLINNVGLSKFDVILEPSAGAGAFYNLLPPEKRIGIDLEPKCDGVKKMDFFEWKPARQARCILTVGNPPFGQRAGLAIKFILRSCEFSDCVAFILPRSFNKYTFQDRVPANFHLVASFDCDNFVNEEGASVSVKSVFQVWQKKEFPRKKEVKAASHPDFQLKHCHLSRVSEKDMELVRGAYPFAIPQVGAKFLIKNSADVKAGSYWFVKPNAAHVREVFEKLDFGFLTGMNTAFTSLSKKDIVRAYNDALGKRSCLLLNSSRVDVGLACCQGETRPCPVNLSFDFA